MISESPGLIGFVFFHDSGSLGLISCCCFVDDYWMSGINMFSLLFDVSGSLGLICFCYLDDF